MTRVRQLIRFMRELESGHDRTQIPLPKQTVFLKTEQPVSGRFVPLACDADDDEDYSDLADLPFVWRPTEEPTPSRWYPARTKAHCRGTITNPVTRSALTYASIYELDLASILCANRHVSAVKDQPAPLRFTRDDGEHDHTTDYLAGIGSYRIHIAVRPSWLISKDALNDTVARINDGVLDGVVDEAIILTEHEITENRGWNARSILRALKAPDQEAVNRLKKYVGDFRGVVAIQDLQGAVQGSAVLWNAVWQLVYDGVLVPIRPDAKLIDAPFVSIDHALI